MKLSPRYPEVAVFLKDRIAEIQKKNDRVSLRLLSQRAGISPGRLSDLLNGQRALTEYYAEKLVIGLRLKKEERDRLYSLVSGRSRNTHPTRVLSEDELSLLVGWENYAILNLLKTTACDSTPEGIAKRLALEISHVKSALATMENLGMVSKVNEGYERATSYLTTTWNIPSESLKKAHENVLLKAIEVLKKTAPDDRYYSSVTLAIDVKKKAGAIEMIEEFRKKLIRHFEPGEKNEVFNLSVQFFPYTDLRGRDDRD